MSRVSSMFQETNIPKAWLDLVDCLEKNPTRTTERQHLVKGTCKEYQESCGKKSFSPKVWGIIYYTHNLSLIRWKTMTASVGATYIITVHWMWLTAGTCLRQTLANMFFSKLCPSSSLNTSINKDRLDINTKSKTEHLCHEEWHNCE